jgi:hypothetical protein
VQANDVLKSVNGIKVVPENANTILRQMYAWNVGDTVDVVVGRGSEDISIKTTLTQAYTTIKALTINKNATEAQINLRKAWLQG